MYFVIFFCQKPLFASKIRRNFAPRPCVPFINGCCPGVVVHPHFGFANHEEQILVLGIPFDLGLAFFLANPCECGHAVGINNPGEIVFLDISEPQHQCEKFADVVGTLLKRSSMEHFGACVRDDSAELHYTRVAATSCIDREGR